MTGAKPLDTSGQACARTLYEEDFYTWTQQQAELLRHGRLAQADLAGARSGETVTVDGAFLDAHIGDLAKNADLSRFIL